MYTNSYVCVCMCALLGLIMCLMAVFHQCLVITQMSMAVIVLCKPSNGHSHMKRFNSRRQNRNTPMLLMELTWTHVTYDIRQCGSQWKWWLWWQHQGAGTCGRQHSPVFTVWGDTGEWNVLKTEPKVTALCINYIYQSKINVNLLIMFV